MLTEERTNVDESGVTWKRRCKNREGELSLHIEEIKYIVEKETAKLSSLFSDP